MTEDRAPTHILQCTMHDECDLDLRSLVTEHHPWIAHDFECECHNGICSKCGCTNEYEPAPPLDVERLTTVLIEAEADDMLGSEYMPSRLAKYIAARLGSRSPGGPR